MSLVTLPEFRTYIGVGESADTPILEATIGRASALVEGVIGRSFASSRVFETHVIDENRRFRVERWPIISVDWLGYGVSSALEIAGDSTDTLSTAEVDENGVTLTRVTSAGTRTQTVISTGETLDQLATAITAVTGFTATALATAPWRTLAYTGPRDCRWSGTFYGMTTPLEWTYVDRESGIVEVADGDWRWLDEDCCQTYSTTVGVIYTGGYATIPADIKQATLETAAQIYRGRRYDTGKTTGDYRTIATNSELIEDIRAMLMHRMEVR